MIEKFIPAIATIGLMVAGVVCGFAQTEKSPDPPAAATRQIVVAVTNGRIRNSPKNGNVLKVAVIGTRLTAVSEKDGWDEVQLVAASEGKEAKTGWISRTITEPYDTARPGDQSQKIADKYFSRKEIGYSTAVQLFEYLPKAADDAKTFEVGGDLRLKSLTALSIALKSIPFGKSENAPYKEFLQKYRDEVVYSEPAGEWYVRSNRFWELHARYKEYKIGELIAFRAAENPRPGECEGYINCYLYFLRTTYGEYLNFYPNGKYSKESIQNIDALLQPIASDVRTKSVYYTTSDVSDRAEFNQMLADMRRIVSNSPHVEKQGVLKLIAQIAEGYR